MTNILSAMSNNDIPVKIPSHPYVLVNRSVLCNYGIEAENNFHLELLAACHDADSKLVKYFMVNTAFVSYLDSLDNLTDSLLVLFYRTELLTNRFYLFPYLFLHLILTH